MTITNLYYIYGRKNERSICKKKEGGITLEMTVLEVVSQWESTQAVFKRWDPAAGECICCNCLFEPIEYLGKKYRLDTQKLIGELNQAASG